MGVSASPPLVSRLIPASADSGQTAKPLESLDVPMHLHFILSCKLGSFQHPAQSHLYPENVQGGPPGHT